jgi:hypothetical protein
MDFFILFTYNFSIIGNASQANYAANNTHMESLTKYRTAQGERTVFPDLGAMLRHGVLAEDESLRERLLKGGLLSAAIPAVLFGLLNYYCDLERGPLLQDFSSNWHNQQSSARLYRMMRIIPSIRQCTATSYTVVRASLLTVVLDLRLPSTKQSFLLQKMSTQLVLLYRML